MRLILLVLRLAGMLLREAEDFSMNSGKEIKGLAEPGDLSEIQRIPRTYDLIFALSHTLLDPLDFCISWTKLS